MALTTKRIIALPSQSEPQEGDYLAIDNATNGTHKIPVGRIGVELDDTLTESGKAADAKATGDAIDALRSQLEVIGTASGAIATFSDGSTMPAKSVIVNIEPQQSGSGTPSPDNVRPISGWESVNVTVSPTQDAQDGTTTPVNLGRTVYGGTLDVVSGVLTSKMGMIDLGDINWRQVGSTSAFYASPAYSSVVGTIKCDSTSRDFVANSICSQYAVVSRNAMDSSNNCVAINKSDTTYISVKDSRYTDATAFKTAMSGVKFCYELKTPQTYTLTPTEVKTLLGENNVWANSGDISVTYVRDLNIAINNLIGG